MPENEYLRSISDSLSSIANSLMIIARGNGPAYNPYNYYGNGYAYGTNPFSLYAYNG